ncbi:MAG: L,D-transpeptidase family protein [Sphingobium sp.]
MRRIAPQLGIGAAGLGVVLLFAMVLGRGDDLAPAPSRAAEPDTAPVASPVATNQPAPLVERSRDQPVAVDRDALIVRRVLPIEGPFRHGDFVWNEEGAPAQGRVIVTVDLKAQTLSVFRAGYEIGAAVIVYGATDKPSPVGAFPITQKKADHISNLYDAPMPFMQRLTNDGVAIHGSDVKWGNATHGCIGVPTPFAKKLFAATKLGDLVVITDGKMLDTSRAERR